jgi:hypothetical protein
MRYQLWKVAVVLFVVSCAQTPPPTPSAPDLPTPDFAPDMGYVNDPLKFQDLPEGKSLNAQVVTPSPCVYADGPYARYYTGKDAKTNAVQFTTIIPSSKPELT